MTQQDETPALPVPPPGPADAPAGAHRLLAGARALHARAVLAELAAPDGSPCTLDEARAHAAVACMVLTGDVSVLPAEARAVMDLVDIPTRAGGWRSRTDITAPGGPRVSVEIITGLDPADGTDATGPAAHRAHALRSIGAADRRLAESRAGQPATRRIPAEDVIDARGAADLLRLSVLLDEVESGRFAGRFPQPLRRVRRMNGFPRRASGNPCELVVEAWLGAGNRFATACIRSHLRRAGTGEILAVGETLYRP